MAIMRFKRAFRLGVKSLWLHRLRSFLTMLGIVFGVCSVIAMLAIGEGASYEAQQQLKGLGSQNIIIQSVKPPEQQNSSTSSETSRVLEYGITYKDVKKIKATIPGVTVVVPGRIMREYVWNISRRVDCEVIATVPWYPQMRNHQVKRGRFFTDLELEDRSNVCVISPEMVQSLFPLSDPIGQSVRIGENYYRVIGVMTPQGSSKNAQLGGVGSDIANKLFIPITTARVRYGEILVKRRSGSFEAIRVELHEVTVKVDERDRVVPVSKVIQDIFEKNHDKEDYNIVVPLELINKAKRTKQIFNIVLGSIAGISLLVGGIGIMNIMLASVTERTREIGIRRALGARRQDIITQFLIETVILSGAGGIVGVVLGITIPYFVTVFANMATIVTLWAPIIAFSISAMVGIVFGIYPAIRAADMDPVEALRHE
ncbi:MAG: ABC transporter permease [Verrucomicrobia bacterium]|nr:ABC transporter permease [Verrucomicrobiota bacterium]MCF7709190.1 ABC transporter permease [Verrucomicrobiota bacterium]